MTIKSELSQAYWIWNDREESPRNEWWLFRKNFKVADDIMESSLAITADSRYVLYVNGERLGQGPVRSWPSEQFYDTYDCTHLLKQGQTNVIAVMVQHYGLSTFQYIRGRGGLLAQLNLSYQNGEEETIITDDSWKTIKNQAQDSTSPRMSCQLPFSEKIDRRKLEEDWQAIHFSDRHWKQATIIGKAGIEPWENLQRRNIPFLTEEPFYAKKIHSLSFVQSFTWTMAFDLRNAMMPDSANHANQVGYTGYLVTNIVVNKPTKAIIGFNYTDEMRGPLSINGKIYKEDAFTGIQPERYVEVELEAGNNLLLKNVSGHVHEGTLRMGIYCEEDLDFTTPLPEKSDSSFLIIGPFDSTVFYDVKENRELNKNEEIYQKVMTSVASTVDLKNFNEWIQEMPEKLISYDDVFTLSAWKKDSQEITIPQSLQQMVIPNDSFGEVPVHDEKDTEMIIDFGEQLSGYLSFEIEAEEGTMIDFYGFEYMDPFKGYIQHTYKTDNTLRYRAKEGRQTYRSSIRRGLRYLQVTIRNAKKPLKWYRLKMIQSHYPVAYIGSFESSNALMNDIWEISERTARLCMEDTFVDCPTYEQAFWVGDSRNQSLINHYLYGEKDIVKRCLKLVPGSKQQNPLYVNQVPSGWNSVIPNWTFFWIIACKEYYEQTEDGIFIEEMFQEIAFTIKHYLEFIDENNLFNIRAWNLLDWAPMDQPNHGVVTHQNLFFVRVLRVAAYIAEVVNDQEKKEMYTAAAEKLLEAIHEHLWSEEKQAFYDCIHADGRKSEIFSMQTQVVAYLVDIRNEQREKRLEELIANPPKDFVQIGSPFMSFFLYEAYEKIGNHKKLLEDIQENYGFMVEKGATTCWEMYPGSAINRANPNMLTRSHCHAWASAPAYFFPRVILGIRPMATGWKQVKIKPEPYNNTWAKGSVPLPDRGRIDVSWRIAKENHMDIIVKHPEEIDVQIEFPDGYTGQVKIKRTESL